MYAKFSRFVVFWTGASLCLVYLVVMLVNSDVIRLGEHSVTAIAYLCIILMVLDLFFLLEYISVPHEKDDKRSSDDE